MTRPPALLRTDVDTARAQEFVTVEQLALLVHASAKTVRRRIAAGKLKGVLRDGRFLRINRVIAIHHWMKTATS